MTLLLSVVAVVVLGVGPGASRIRPTPRIGIRVFKREAILEVWGSTSTKKPFHRLGRFKVAAMSGELGPKRKEGDLQVPEGFYHIERFNPNSRFHLSLGINYPNASDRILADPQTPGFDIFIHGNEVSAGCMAMTDRVIDVIYPLAVHARDAGQKNIPVQIFPCQMTTAKMAKLREEYSAQPELLAFWENLKPGFDAFEKTRLWTIPSVAADGRYVWH